MKTVGERLDKAAKIGGYRSRRQMARELDIPYSTMNKWVDRNSLPASAILKITNSIPISRTYLETGTGDAELVKETGISNYGHPARADDIMAMYIELDMDDQKLIYQLAGRLHRDKETIL